MAVAQKTCRHKDPDLIEHEVMPGIVITACADCKLPLPGKA